MLVGVSLSLLCYGAMSLGVVFSGMWGCVARCVLESSVMWGCVGGRVVKSYGK